MNGYTNLLLVVDPTHHNVGVLQRAAALAVASGALLHIYIFLKPLRFSDWIGGLDQKAERNRYLTEIRSWLQAQILILQPKVHGLSISTEVLWSQDRCESIEDAVQVQQPDLLIKTVEHESTFKRVFMMPVDWHLLRECPVPVYLMCAQAQGVPKKVVAAVDLASQQEGISLDEHVIEAAIRFAHPYGAELHLVHAFDFASMQVPDYSGERAWEHFVMQQRSACEARLALLAERYQVPSQRRHLIEGSTLPVLSERLKPTDSDVIVIGRSRHDGIDTWRGNTAERLLAKHPACGVLAVGPVAEPLSLPERLQPLRQRLDSLIQALFPD